MLRTILISALTLNLGLLLGRLSGFFREALVAANFGVSFEADIVVLMLTVPDMMVALLVGGAMGAVMVPAFSQSKQSARILLYQASLLFGLTFCVVAAVLSWQSDLLVSILVPGFESGQIDRASANLSLALWLIPLSVLAGITTAFLHSENKFIVASLGTLLVNCSIIAGLYLVLIEQASIESVAFFILLGGAVRLAVQVTAVRPSFHPVKYLRPLLLERRVFVHYAQAMMSGSLLFLFPVIARAFASYEDTGSVALLNYAVRLMELPMAICIGFLAIILFPRMAESHKSDAILHLQYIKSGTQATLVLSVVATISLVMLSDEYSDSVFGYGEMSRDTIQDISVLISTGLFSLPLKGLAMFNNAIFYSRANTLTPLAINGIGLASFFLFLTFNVFADGLIGIMQAMVASFLLICLLQSVFLSLAKVPLKKIYFDKEFLFAAGLSGGSCFLLGHLIANLEQHPMWKLTMGLFVALFALLIAVLFYADIRDRVKENFF